MPRLKGRRSPAGLSSLIILLVIVAVALPLEYFGATNFISNSNSQDKIRQPIATDDSINKIDTIDK